MLKQQLEIKNVMTYVKADTLTHTDPIFSIIGGSYHVLKYYRYTKTIYYKLNTLRNLGS